MFADLMTSGMPSHDMCTLRYWVGLTRTHLYFFARRQKLGLSREAFVDKPSKTKSIKGAVLLVGDADLDRKFALRLENNKVCLIFAPSLSLLLWTF